MTSATDKPAARAALDEARKQLSHAESMAIVASSFAIDHSDTRITPMMRLEHLHHVAEATTHYIAAAEEALEHLERLAF